MGWTTLSVREETADRYNELKANTGDESVQELSADEFLTSLMDAWEENGESIHGEQVDVDDLKAVAATPEDLTKLRSDLLEQLGRNYEAIKEATQAAQSAEQTVEGLR